MNKLLAQKDYLTYQIVHKIDLDLNFTTTENPELKQRWFPLCIINNYNMTDKSDCYKNMKDFISSQGRMKYINPIYQALMVNGRKDLAFAWFRENLAFYHPIAIAKLKQILMLGVTKEDEKLLKIDAKRRFLGRVKP